MWWTDVDGEICTDSFGFAAKEIQSFHPFFKADVVSRSNAFCSIYKNKEYRQKSEAITRMVDERLTAQI